MIVASDYALDRRTGRASRDHPPPRRNLLRSGLRPAPGRPESDACRNERAPDRLLANPEPQPHIHERQTVGVQLSSFCEVALIETAPADRDRAADKMRCRRAAVHAEPLAQLHQGRARLLQGHQLVHLRRTQKGLSHPNCAHHPPSRVHYGRFRRSPVSSVDAP